MDEAAFRIVVAVGVGLVTLSFIGMTIAMFSIYSIGKAIEQRIQGLTGRVTPTLDKVGPVLDKAAPLIERAGPFLDKAGQTIQTVGGTAASATALLESANRIVEDNRPRVSEVCGEAVAIAETGRQQVERIGELIYEAGDRARTRLQQIDTVVESTVDQVEHAGESLSRAVMRPVREVNGIAAGISAAVSTLVKGPRRSSVDSATQDEEMFI